ncbi:MAG: type I polyketide synthase [Panacagrimonas sp.]
MKSVRAGAPLEIAIIGIAGCYAGAPNARVFWQNVLDMVDSVTEAGPEWAGPYFKANTLANDRTYTTRGGFLRGLAEVNPVEFGVLPNIVDGGDPDQLMALKYARDALIDAGYLKGSRAFDPQRAGVVIGRGTYGNRAMASVMSRGLFLDQAMSMAHALRPDLSSEDLAELREVFQSQLPAFNADMVSATTPNVIAGLIANRLNLMGPNYILDAACASALFALDAAVRELLTGRCDLMLAGAVQSHTPPQLYIQFCQIQALSHNKIRPFQTGADGILLGEGVGMLVLKRLADAERDGDSIYAVIQGIGLASDGKAKGLLAPRVEGQVMALQQAYSSSGIDPLTVDLIEAHGTGTAAGDRAEIDALNIVFGARGAGPQIAVGSVKSMIGHCLPAAGSASLIKTALALHHKLLPPTLCDPPNPELVGPGGPLYINNQARPWMHGGAHPRRAGVNAFGFGGANAHVILEEYTGPRSTRDATLHAPCDSELLMLTAASVPSLVQLAESALSHLRGPAPVSVAEVAKACSAHVEGDHRLAIVADGVEDLVAKLGHVIEALQAEGPPSFGAQTGIYYGSGAAPGKVCFLFPGKGTFPGEATQYPDMLAELCMHFPKARECFDCLERSGLADGMEARAPILFPAPGRFDESRRQMLEANLNQPDSGFECAFMASLAILRLLDDVAIRADALLGYGAGEFTAIVARKDRWFDHLDGHLKWVRKLARLLSATEADEVLTEGVVVFADTLWPETRQQLLDKLAEEGSPLALVADNCTNQMTLFGPSAEALALAQWLQDQGSTVAHFSVKRPHHTPRCESLATTLRTDLQDLDLGAKGIDLYSACSAGPFPPQPDAARELLAAQWEQPVRLTETIRRLYADGFRVFIEVGPTGMLTNFVSDILWSEDGVTALACDRRGYPGIRQLHHVLAQAFATGVVSNPAGLFADREIARMDLSGPPRSRPNNGIKLKLQMPELRVPAGWRPMPRSP